MHKISFPKSVAMHDIIGKKGIKKFWSSLGNIMSFMIPVYLRQNCEYLDM